MQLDRTDPGAPGRALRPALLPACVTVALMWAIFSADALLGLHLVRFGIEPRAVDGLIGLLAAPLLHGGLAHLASNTLPMLLLTTGVLYLYPRAARFVLPAVWLGTGLAVWLLARGSVHIGASGVVYGLAAYIFFAGVVRRDARAVAATLIVYFLYGSMVWGVLPLERGVSWESHLAGAVIGTWLAFGLRHLDRVPRKRYAWEADDAGPA